MCPMNKYTIRSVPEKWEILRKVKESPNRRERLRELGVSSSTYYDWVRKGPEPQSRAPKKVWNRTPKRIRRVIKVLRETNDPLKSSPMRIMEYLEYRLGYIMSEPGVKSVLRQLPDYRPKARRKKQFYIRPKAEKFLQVICVDELEWLRFRPRDTFALNWVDEASGYVLRVTVFDRKPNQRDVLTGLRSIRKQYGRHPKIVRSDNARIFASRSVQSFMKRHSINPDFITKGCPEENWPVESSNGLFKLLVIRRKGFESISDWQRELDKTKNYYNDFRRLRSDPILRTPREIAFAFATPQTQRRIMLKLMRKHKRKVSSEQRLLPTASLQVSEMCVS